MPGAVRNAGIAQARGEYILCLDADDKLHPDFLRACVTALDATPEAAIAYADFQMFGDSDALQQPPPWNARVELDCNFIGTASMFRRAVWAQVGGYDPEPALVGYEDWDFWIGCVEHGWAGSRRPARCGTTACTAAASTPITFDATRSSRRASSSSTRRCTARVSGGGRRTPWPAIHRR